MALAHQLMLCTDKLYPLLKKLGGEMDISFPLNKRYVEYTRSRFAEVNHHRSQRKNKEGKDVYGFPWDTEPYHAGAHMETIEKSIEAVNVELAKSIKTLEDSTNKIKMISGIVLPDLTNLILKIRNNRQSVVMELQTSLNMLRDVRKFFLESDYEEEIKRMERFISVCKEIKKLKEEGTLDAICDTAIRLGIGEKEETK